MSDKRYRITGVNEDESIWKGLIGKIVSESNEFGPMFFSFDDNIIYKDRFTYEELPTEEVKVEKNLTTISIPIINLDATQKVQPPHYSQGTISPIEYIEANKMDFIEGNIIQYVTRYKHKNGIDDLKKAQDYLNRLIERESK